MPAFNAESTIAESIHSVLFQTFQNWELIIINDGSTDKTYDIAIGFASLDNRIRILDLPQNTGVSNARNQGALSANGKYLAFLDSDDLWHFDKLKIQISFHKTHPECAISHTDYVNFSEYGKIRAPFKFFFRQFIRKKGDLLRQLLYFNSITTLTVIMKKNLFIDLKGFDCELTNLEDQDLWLRISKKGYYFSYLNNELSFYRVHQYGLMSNIGRFKSNYKFFINKHGELMHKNSKYKIARAYYYRYFGISYFKSNNYKLAFLYLRKAVALSKNIYLQMITVPYVVISFLKFRKNKVRFI
jgi:glycosyltransferase involved in cell wall biosynthesis